MIGAGRVVCHFSCGAASAVAAKLAITEYGCTNVVIVNAFIQEEHEDNRRFLADCEKWFGKSITVLRDEKYGSSAREVWRRRRFIKSNKGAACSRVLKRDVIRAFLRHDDINVLGYTVEESERYNSFIDANNDMITKALLIDRGLTKQDCLSIIDRAGIELPITYRLGFDNANCIGCPKGGQSYWQHIRKHFPDDFLEVSAIQSAIGPSASFLAFRSGDKKGQRMSLSELPSGEGNMQDEPSFNCSLFCELAEREIEGGEK